MTTQLPSAPAGAPTADHRIPQAPDPGQVVEVRGSVWAVTDVTAQGLPRSSADDGTARLEHVVTLQSLDEDRMGEELTVIWELELGQSVVPDRGLPESIAADAFDDPDTLGAFVDAVRWGAVTSADPGAFQAPFRSGATLEPYQLEPLRRALAAPRTNLLLADDVGLGKTIEAGLVIEELLLRHRARSVIIVCPPSLAIKWQAEMREKFGLDFVIVDSARMATDRRTYGLAANPLRLHPRVIVSMAWLPGVRAQRLLREVLADAARSGTARSYAFDVLVVDEAHHVAPATPSAAGGGDGYAVDSQRTRALRRLAESCEHRLFLSATPHNGYTESFSALLEMIDPRRFARGASIDTTALNEVTVRRLKSQIAEKNFRQRKVKVLPYEASPEEEQAYATLDGILRASGRAQGRRHLDIAALLLKKRFLSSPWAFAQTLSGYLDQSLPSGLEDYDDEDYYTEVMGSGQSDEEEGLTAQPEMDTLLATRASDPLSAATREQLEALADWGRGYQSRPDSRLAALVSFLDAVCRPDGRTWTNERVVVFTEYADTVEWILSVLRQQGYDDRLEVIRGSTSAEEREDVRARFTASPTEEEVRVLVATDAAGEGIDLQDHCHRLVNFDVPFNPSRLEQRVGRIDRYGQRQAPEIYYLAPLRKEGLYAGHQEFLQRLATKIATETQDLGAINPLIDENITREFLGRSLRKARAQGRDEQAITDALAGSARLNQRLTALAAGYEKRKKQMHLSAAAGRRVVDEALRMTHQPLLEEVGSEETDAAVYAVPALGRSWQEALAGLDTRLAPGRLRPVTFDEEAGRVPGIVHLHLGHPLMRKATRTLRANLFSPRSEVSRVTAVVLPGLEHSCAASLSRLVLVGRGGLRLHEEVFVTGVRLRGHRVAEGTLSEVLDRALDPQGYQLAAPQVRAHLTELWNDDGHLRTRLVEETERRAESLQDQVDSRLEERRLEDTQRVRAIFAAFRANLTDSLERLRTEERESQDMLALWAEDQRHQRARDLRAMEDRLAALGDEEEREAQTMDLRYQDVRPYVASVALVLAVTEEDAMAWGRGS
ncbi:DISARM system SNF2-like helicase DrmD [Actinomyces howellii]|uniref:RNA polymerase-associated protein rapA n=1 Tax=Actinomyces howellii TaxID=52771 RepID=A0A448HH66_9ACTO|nr:DISARM system SNF2-like helicase DrmD [Actinomyces howellii]VEG28351.1 RNA polymerase-associated protein rapA [Actinomyces howellii]